MKHPVELRERPYKHALEVLQGAGLRPTKQRLALAKFLFDGRHRHITAEQLHAQAADDRFPISLATVYNTLHQFTRAGLLREVVVDANRSYFDTNTADHHHFFHERTGELQDIKDLIVANLPQPPNGARIARVDVVIRLDDTEDDLVAG